jgi:potassium voltage-gated channel Shab-related subfamily B protein 1
LSTTTLFISTIPEFKIKVYKNLTTHKSGSLNNSGLISNAHIDLISLDNKDFEYKDNEIFEWIEIICIIWFTIEFCLRFWSSPNNKCFIKGPTNFIDVVSIVPFYLSILSNASENIMSHTKVADKLFPLFRMLRILRIFKLARHSQGLKAFGYTMKKSYDEFTLLLMLMSIAVLLFSSLIYFAEKGEDSTLFRSIPDAFW